MYINVIMLWGMNDTKLKPSSIILVQKFISNIYIFIKYILFSWYIIQTDFWFVDQSHFALLLHCNELTEI